MLEKYLESKYLKWFKRGEFIQRNVDPVDYMYYLSKGLAVISRINDRGEETIIRYAKAPTFLGVPTIFSARKLEHEVDTTICACSDCKVYKIPYQILMQKAKENVEIYEEMLIEQSMETRYFRELMKYVAKGKSANAVALFLDSVIINEQDSFILPHEITFTDMASFLHMHNVTLSKIIKKFTNEGVLNKKNGVIYITDTEKLKKYAAGEECIYW